jgi:coiled-coil domain-containing protein 12
VEDLSNIAPKRPNWDLKRDLNKKLIPLERSTREAIYTLVRLYHFIANEGVLTHFSAGNRLGSETNDASKDIASAMDARAAAEESDDE